MENFIKNKNATDSQMKVTKSQSANLWQFKPEIT
jgi:hypothetical protein